LTIAGRYANPRAILNGVFLKQSNSYFANHMEKEKK